MMTPTSEDRLTEILIEDFGMSKSDIDNLLGRTVWDSISLRELVVKMIRDGMREVMP